MKRFLAVFLMLAILLTSLTVAATADTKKGWVLEDGLYYYYNDKGEMVKNDWVKGKDGKTWYYLTDSGVMAEEELLEIKDKFYAFKKGGAMVANGWYEEKGVTEDGEAWSEWYYAGADGALVKGWNQIGGKWYYFHGTQKRDKDWWPFMTTGVWFTWDDEKEDYVSLFDNGKFYGFKPSGEMIVGWGQIGKSADSIWVYGNADGSLIVKNWKKIDGKWYYFDDTGWMYRNQVTRTYDKNDKNFYLFDKSGALVENGWYQPYWIEDGVVYKASWYYGGKDGVVQTGWLKDGGKWYYLDAEYGYMYDDNYGLVEMSDGKTYTFKKSGEMVIGWYQYEGTWYYFNESGAMVKKAWQKTGGKWYYLKDDGSMAKSETLTIDGKEYTFDENGAMK